MTNKNTPKYRKQNNKYGAVAFIVLNQQRYYLGTYDSTDSWKQYYQLISEYEACNGYLNRNPETLNINQFVNQYRKHYELYYRHPNGKPTGEQSSIRIAMAKLCSTYGDLTITEFSPLKLKTIRDLMIKEDLSRNTINNSSKRIVRAFKWGVENEIIKPEMLTALKAVPGLKAGRSMAKESKPIEPAPENHVNSVKPFVSRQVWALIQLQLLTGARSGELVKLKACDIDTKEQPWVYQPTEHKTAYRGHTRMIFFGKKAQKVLSEFIGTKPFNEYLFSPKDARKEKGAQATTHRRPNQKATPTKTSRVIKDHYTTQSYQRAIARACIEANVPHWHPHQLRHTAGTKIRQQYGLEEAQVVLGHSQANTTEIYAKRDHDKARLIMKTIG